jgi:hypothetical protein
MRQKSTARRLVSSECTIATLPEFQGPGDSSWQEPDGREPLTETLNAALFTQ